MLAAADAVVLGHDPYQHKHNDVAAAPMRMSKGPHLPQCRAHPRRRTVETNERSTVVRREGAAT